MSIKEIFSKKIVFIVSVILTSMSIVIYLLALAVRMYDNNFSLLGFVLVFLVLILACLQIYFLLIKDRKSILLTNIHLSLILCFSIYELINELMIYGYTSVINGIFYIIIFIVASLFVVNRYKISFKKYAEIEELGKPK